MRSSFPRAGGRCEGVPVRVSFWIFLCYLILLYLAVSRAMQVEDKDMRVLHLSLAVLAPPFYLMMSILSQI